MSHELAFIETRCMVDDAPCPGIAPFSENPDGELPVDPEGYDALHEDASVPAQECQAHDLALTEVQLHRGRTHEAYIGECSMVPFHPYVEPAVSQGAFEDLRDRSAGGKNASGERTARRGADAEGDIVDVKHGASARGAPQDRKRQKRIGGGEILLVVAYRHGRLAPVVDTQDPVMPFFGERPEQGSIPCHVPL